MDACMIDVLVNGDKKLDDVLVPGEHQGRTTHEIELEDAHEDNEVCVHFIHGEGILFLESFEIEVRP